MNGSGTNFVLENECIGNLQKNLVPCTLGSFEACRVNGIAANVMKTGDPQVWQKARGSRSRNN